MTEEIQKMLSGEQYTERFGLVRLWHPICDYLFAVICSDGRLGWTSIYGELTEEQRNEFAHLRAVKAVGVGAEFQALVNKMSPESQARVRAKTQELIAGMTESGSPSPFVADCRAIEEWGRASGEAALKGEPVPVLALPSKAAA